jgi:hypothetical protein
MKVFHELAYEGFVLADGTGVGLVVFSDPRLMELIGAVDVAHVSGYSAQVTGTSPQLTIWIDYSNDRSYFAQPDAPNPIINNLALSTSSETLFQGVYPDPTDPRNAYARLAIRVTGTNARAFLRIWVTGRDRSRRSAGMSQVAPMARQMLRMGDGMNGNGTYGAKG